MTKMTVGLTEPPQLQKPSNFLSDHKIMKKLLQDKIRQIFESAEEAL